MSSISSQELALSLSVSSEPGCDTLDFARSTLFAGECLPSTGPMSPVTRTFDSLPTSSPSMASAAAFPASPSAPRLADGVWPQTSGPTCSASSIASDPGLSSQRTSRKRQSPSRLNVSMDLAIQRTTAVLQGLTSGQTIKEIVGGSLHTPTRKANFVAPSMQKWPSCRRFVLAFGGREITPEQFEFLMGLPIGWTELEPSATPSFRRSRKRSAERS